ncbi:putative Sulfotransferase [Candidatus Magnetomoraceae bacterium gMMP-15]
MKTKKQIFIGGTGRCGTSVLAHMIKLHQDIFYFPEPRFLIDPGGLKDLLSGCINLDTFRKNMVTHFRRIMTKNLINHGWSEAHLVYSSKNINKIIEKTFCGNKNFKQSAAGFIDELFGVALKIKKKKYWAEKTPHTILIADTIYNIYPTMKFIHIIREPKDVFCSMLEQEWGPNNIQEFITYYKIIMEKAYIAQIRIPRENYFVINLESFVTNKYQSIKLIFDFIDIRNNFDTIEKYFGMVNRDRANIHKFKKILKKSEIEFIDQHCSKTYSMWKNLEAQSAQYINFINK